MNVDALKCTPSDKAGAAGSFWFAAGAGAADALLKLGSR